MTKDNPPNEPRILSICDAIESPFVPDPVLEAAANKIVASGDYRVLRRMRAKPSFGVARNDQVHVAAIVDVETTSLDTSAAEIIELAMLKFTYTHSGDVLDARETFTRLREPWTPIPESITRLTGITMDMVRGHDIDAVAVERFLSGVDLVIAHNATYDRPIVERRWSRFAELPWACSLTEIPSRDHGHSGVALGSLLAAAGQFHDGHRALDDCWALLHVLARPLGYDDRPALATLLRSARTAHVRIWAVDSPFATKDLLKSWGYRWCDGVSGARRAWWRDVPEREVESEFARLREQVYCGSSRPLSTTSITAVDRYSNRMR